MKPLFNVILKFEVLFFSLLITEKCGGDGVLYEVVELILKSKNQYEEVINTMKDSVF